VNEHFQLLHEFKISPQATYLTIGVDEAVPCVVDIWTGPFGSQLNFRNGMEKVLEVMMNYQYYKWLADLSRMEGSWDSSREWMLTHILPKAIAGGLKFAAIVLPEDAFARLSTLDTIGRLDGYLVKQFGDFGLARDWLSKIS
jgi:hypothetical protein